METSSKPGWAGEKAVFTMASQRGQDIIAPRSGHRPWAMLRCPPVDEITGSLCWRRRCDPSDLLNQAQAAHDGRRIAVGEIEAAEKVAEGGAAEPLAFWRHCTTSRLDSGRYARQPRSLGRLAILQPGLSGFQGLDSSLICWPVADQFDAQALNDGVRLPFVEAEKSL